MALTDLTAQEKRMIQDYNPSLSNRAPGFDLAKHLQAIIDDSQLVQTKSGVVPDGATTVALSFTSVPAGAAIVACISGAAGASTFIKSAVRTDATTVTVTVDQDPAGGNSCAVSCLVDARA
jgi:hypothetical protein